MSESVWSYPRIAARLFNQPHAITPSKLHAIVWAVKDRMGVDVGRPPTEAFMGGDESEAGTFRIERGVAVVPVHGTLVQKGGQLDAESGLLGYDFLLSQIEAAEADNRVDAVLLDVDSGGGEVAGALDTADRISQMAQRFPMAALANESACSAAYLMAAATGRVWVTQGAAIGSIGVIMAHVDQTQANEQDGLKVTEIFSGARKADGSPHHELQDDELARLQGFVDQTNDMLINKIASFRGVSENAIRSTEAGVYLSDARFERSLADDLHTLDSAIAALERPQSTRRGQHMATQDRNKVKAGENLASLLNDLISQQTTDERGSQDIQEDMADAAGISPSTVDSILNAEINCPPLVRLEGFAEVLNTTVETLVAAGEEDGCDYSSDEGEASAKACPAPAQAADAADIVDLCTQAGVPDQAASLIREGATMAKARRRVNAIGTMRERCQAAVSAGMVTQARADELLKAALDTGKSADQLSTDLLTVAMREQSADEAVQSLITPDARAESSDDGWQHAADKVAKQIGG